MNNHQELEITAGLIPDEVEHMSLHHILKSTWEHSMTRNSLVSLVIDHTPSSVSVLINTLLISIVLLSPTYILHYFYPAIQTDTVAYQLCAVLWSLIIAYIVQRAVYHMLRLSTLKKRVFKFEIDPLRTRPGKWYVNLIGILAMIAVFLIARFVLLPYLGGLEVMLLISLGLFALLHGGMYAHMHYHSIMESAKYLVGYIQLKLNQDSKKIVE